MAKKLIFLIASMLLSTPSFGEETDDAAAVRSHRLLNNLRTTVRELAKTQRGLAGEIFNIRMDLYDSAQDTFLVLKIKEVNEGLIRLIDDMGHNFEKKLKKQKSSISKQVLSAIRKEQYKSFRVGLAAFGTMHFIAKSYSESDVFASSGFGAHLRWIRSYLAFEALIGTSITFRDPSFVGLFNSSILIYSKHKNVGCGPSIILLNGRNNFTLRGGGKIDFAVAKKVHLWALPSFGIINDHRNNSFLYSVGLMLGITQFLW